MPMYGVLKNPPRPPLTRFRSKINFSRYSMSPVTGSLEQITVHQNNTVFLFDSIDQCIPPTAVSQLWSILGADVKRITIQARPVQAQENSYDCGSFAIANAYIVAAGRDPCLYNYDKFAMRAHLLRCICDGEPLQFPTTTAYVSR
ncbi:unnamed protein product, partial [Ixodes hexagonus]